MSNKFDWIPFYIELADKLLEFKNKSSRLATIIYKSFDRETEIKFLHDEDGLDFKEIDPFTVFSIISRGMNNRKEIVDKVKKTFKIDAKVPTNFQGIPTQNPMNSAFCAFYKHRTSDGKDINRLWTLFEYALLKKPGMEEVFNSVLKQYSIAVPKLTMGLFYIRPYDFLSLDKNNCEYLSAYDISINPSKIHYKEYIGLLKQVRNKMKRKEILEQSFPEFCYNAIQNEADISDVFCEDYIDLLLANHNLVLTGAPGTGKTYLAKRIAEEMGAEYEMVQFHPSYDYTDFVEGLRPTEDGSFERRDGVFKKFCAKALENLQDSRKSKEALQQEMSVRELIDGFIDEAIDKETTFETSGTKNSFHIVENGERKITVDIPNNEKTNRIQLPKSDLQTLLENKVEIAGGKEIQEYFKRKYRTQQDSYVYVLYGLLKKLPRKKQAKDVELIEQKNYVFIIDEINRGEISKIFGELFFSIDPGYRGEKGRVKTQYQNMVEEDDVFKDGFFVPENVYIIGTMNDIDRSVESMDFAMRRRFAWKEVTAEESYANMIEQDEDFSELKEEIRGRMWNLNKAICDEKFGLGEAYQIGAAYYKKVARYAEKDADTAFDKLWDNHLKGLLTEYLRGNRNAKDQLEVLREAYNKTEMEDANLDNGQQ